MDSQDAFEYAEKASFEDSFSKLADLRRNGDLCDVTIKANDKTFTAHRVILAARIPYFKNMFMNQLVERAKKEIIMKDVDPTALECLIDFAYKARLNITATNVCALLKTSLYLQCDSATKACFQFLSRRPCAESVLTILTFAHSAEHTSAKKSAERFVRLNFEDFSKSEEFLFFSSETLKEILSRDDLFVTTEHVVFEAVVRWIKADKSRLVLLPELMSHVRLPLITVEYTKNHQSFQELIRSSPSGEDLLNTVMKSCSSTDTVPRNLGLMERYCKDKHHLKCAKVTGSSMYAVFRCGVGTCHVKYYDSIYEKWETLRKLSEYGYVLNDYVVSVEEKIHFIRRTLICTLNLKTMEFASLRGNFDIPRLAGIVSHHNKIYFVGGYSDSDSSTKLVQQFCPQNGSIVVTGTMVVGRMCAYAVSLEDNIYITGGHPNSANQRRAEKFNPITGQSVVIPPMLVDRSYPECAALNGKLYVCGGKTDGWTAEQTWSFPYSLTAEVYDPSTDQWRFITPMNRSMATFKLFPYAGKLYAVNNTWKETAEIYDPENNNWKSIKFVLQSDSNEELITVITGTDASQEN